MKITVILEHQDKTDRLGAGFLSCLRKYHFANYLHFLRQNTYSGSIHSGVRATFRSISFKVFWNILFNLYVHNLIWVYTWARPKKQNKTQSTSTSKNLLLGGKKWWTDFYSLEIPTAYIVWLIKASNQVTLMNALIHSYESLQSPFKQECSLTPFSPCHLQLQLLHAI